MKIAAVSGSLRAGSSNTAVLRAAARLAPDGVEVIQFEGIAGLPFFNPDLDGDNVPAPVGAMREMIGSVDGLLISSPEYARGVAGVLKNALDWLVSDPAFAGKPVVLLSADRGSTWAIDSLREILRTMSAEVLTNAAVTLRLTSNTIDAEQSLSRPELTERLQQSVAALLAAFHSREL